MLQHIVLHLLGNGLWTCLLLLCRWSSCVARWVFLIYRSRRCLNCAAVFWLFLLTSASVQRQHWSRASCWTRYITGYNGFKLWLCLVLMRYHGSTCTGPVPVRTGFQMPGHHSDISVQPLSQTNVPLSNRTSSRGEGHRWGKGCTVTENIIIY